MQGTSTWHAGKDVAATRAGTTVRDWRIEARVGAGPVCESWLARRGDELAVVRWLREPLASDERARAEWVRASWAANRFHHGRVVRVLDEGTDARGAPFVVRAWTRGESLESAVRRGAVDTLRALRLAEHLLDALEMAHAHGIVHAALTPANVIVTPRWSARLVDFASPGKRAPERTPPHGALDPLLGPAHVLALARVGAFTPPEQRGPRAALPTEQGDVWSLGACLRFALPDAAGDAGAVIDRAMAPDPADRYESAYAMLGDVRRVLAGRRPKLAAAAAPVPSHSASAMRRLAGPTSSVAMFAARPGSPPARARRREWIGNALLGVAIAALVGAAAAVIVREHVAPRAAGAPAQHE